MKPALRLLALCSALALAGCSGDPEPPSEPAARPFAGRTVRVMAPAPLRGGELWSLIFTEFENEWGAKPLLAEYDPHEGLPWLTPPRETDRGPDAAALVFLPLTDLADASARRPLAPIPRDERDGSDGDGGLSWADVFSGLRNSVCSRNGEPVVIPVSAPVLVCYYRRDLLERSGLTPPASWDDYQKLLDTLAEWAPGLTAVEPWSPEYRATMFLARAVGSARHSGQYSLYFDIETGEPLIHSPGFVRGLEQAVAALGRMPADVLTYSPANCRRELLAGRAALAIAFEARGDSAEFPIGPGGWTADTSPRSAGGTDAPANERAEEVVLGVVPLPGATQVFNRTTASWEQPRDGAVNRVSLAGFAGLCAGVLEQADADSQRAAWKLLARLTVDEFATAFPHEVTTLCRTSQLDEPSRWVGDELAGEEVLAWVTAVSQSLRDPLLVAELPVVGREKFRQALSEALGAALAGTQTPPAALAVAADRWQEIAQELGVDAVRDSYRLSLGLPPASR